MRTLYVGRSSGTLPASARSERVAARSAIAAIPGGIQGLLQFPIAAGVVASLPARAAGGQSAQVDAGDARAGHRPRSLPELPALHHARDVGVDIGVAAPAGAAARARRDAGDRRHQLPQARHTLRRRGAAVLRRARQDRQLPSGDHGVALGQGARLDAGRDALSAPGVDARSRAVRTRARADGRAVSGEMAPGAHVAAARPRGRLDVHGRARRRGLRRRDGLSRGVAPPRVCPTPWAFRRI